MKQTVLIVDDNQDAARFLEDLVKSGLDVEARSVHSGESALGVIERNTVHCVLADMKMPGMDGMELLRKLKKKDGLLPVIMITAHGTIDAAVKSMKEGAYDFITKPFEEELLLHTVRRALEHPEHPHLKPEIEEKILKKEKELFFVGESRAIRELAATLRRVARTDVPVLITGETGTGKELAARMIHSLSGRTDGPFVVVNCPAIPENILESELFGYRKGAFTGANSDREGLFHAAEGGTLFLDEIGDISSSLQAKLLRVLQDGEMKPLGDAAAQSIDVRIIAATNRDLESSVASGLFRSDLYYRLNVVPVHTPPLREIPEDIPLMAFHFLFQCCAEMGLGRKRLTEDAIRLLLTKEWEGNARELRNWIKRAVIFSKNEFLSAADFVDNKSLAVSAVKDPETSALAYKKARKKMLETFNKEYIADILRHSGGNVSLAARTSGIERQYLQQLMKKNGIASGEFRKG